MIPILDCVGIGKSFDGLQAAKGIDLSVDKSEMLGVIGANGAGKTTLLNIVSGYLKPSTGRVCLRGEDVTGLAPRQIKHKGVGRSFQIPQIFDRSTMLENVMLALSLACDRSWTRLRPFDNEMRAKEAYEILDALGIAQFAETTAGALPHGVRKLLDIALALTAKPDLVLLDEPTSGVSTEEKNAVMTTLWDGFARNQTTVVFIEHDMELVGRYATRVVALHEGEVIASGSPDKVLLDAQVVRVIRGSRARDKPAAQHA
jgi:branched-chain amino acid transport system ATP-binding protein